MFFGGGGGPRFTFPNMQRGGSTQFVFRNGNVEYKVFSGGNANTNNAKSYSTKMHEESDEEDDVNSILKLLLNQGIHGRSNSTRSRHEKTSKDDDYKQKMFETINNRIRQQSYEKYNVILTLLFLACLFFFILGICWLLFKRR